MFDLTPPPSAMLLYHRPVPAKIPKRRSRAGCVHCKEKKKKCNEERPSCDRCLERGLRCEYEPVKPRKRRRTVSNPEHMGIRPPSSNPSANYGFHDRLQALRNDSSTSSLLSGSTGTPLPAIAENWEIHSANSVFSDTASSCGSDQFGDMSSPLPPFGPYDAMSRGAPSLEEIKSMPLDTLDAFTRDPFDDQTALLQQHQQQQNHHHNNAMLHRSNSYPDPASAFLSPQSTGNPYDFTTAGAPAPTPTLHSHATPSLASQQHSPNLPPYSEFTSRESRRGLLDHFCNVLSHLIVFKEDAGNPFRQFILPMARKSPPLLNAIYAISAAHLEHRGLQVEERALDLHSKALQGLAGLIAHKDENNRDEVLAVIILLLYYEIVRSGSREVLTSHLRGALSIMRERRARRSATSAFLERAFRYFDVAAALSFGTPPMAGTVMMPTAQDFVSVHDRSAMGAVDTLFGLIVDLWPIIHRLASLVEVKRTLDESSAAAAAGGEGQAVAGANDPAAQSNGTTTSSAASAADPNSAATPTQPSLPTNIITDPAKLESIRSDFDTNTTSLELALQQWSPKVPPAVVTLDHPADDSRLQSIMNNAEAHRQASFVFLYRNLHGLARSDAKVQGPTKQTLQACLRVVIFSGPMATLVWPLFTAAVEAIEDSDRNVARTVFKHLENRQGMNNIVTAYEVCEEIWRRSDAAQLVAQSTTGIVEDGSNGVGGEGSGTGAAGVEWRDVARSMGKDILFG